MLDLDLLEKLLSEAGAEEDWTVYQCDFCTKESACGFNGESLDCSRDECHHPMLLVDANLLAALHNAAPSLLALARAGMAVGGMGRRDAFVHSGGRKGVLPRRA